MLSLSPTQFLRPPPSASPSAGFRPPIIIATATATTTTTTFKEKKASSSYLRPPQGRMASSTSLYEILGLPTGATREEVKSAYRRLARVCHPDVAAVERKDRSADEFIKIHAAYCTLSDPEKRAVYDRKIFRRPVRPLSTGFSGYTGRNWETDQCW
ncbi:chaperone protein dnaJ 11 chloroplastic [Tripterygium wilfordii]|uniref:Chaperone protein dnaJ 11 chloroplastic n=1 Tax=Tripterygium wilfordii TaxID=458696 RepID=A0A7J7E307_TRIWF|nr:chaperone protein dnaJ 11, chloroplastic [Tripterygium wilfordii]KAF5753042.1 chaperone protein dnaJ 11 chloroplastic [Tripterygium wilfordii]